MTTSTKVTEFLKKNKIRFEIIPHKKATTAEGTAKAEHEIPQHIAKVVMVKSDGKTMMAVIPANCQLDLLKMKAETGADKVEIEKEADFRDLFLDSEVGAMPPLGQLYGVPCFVDFRIAESDHILFNAGAHDESVKMSTSDYLRIVEAKVANIAVPKK